MLKCTVNILALLKQDVKGIFYVNIVFKAKFLYFLPITANTYGLNVKKHTAGTPTVCRKVLSFYKSLYSKSSCETLSSSSSGAGASGSIKASVW